MQFNARLLAKKPTELEEGEWTAAAAGKLEPNMTRRSSLRAIPQNSAKRCKAACKHAQRRKARARGRLRLNFG